MTELNNIDLWRLFTCNVHTNKIYSPVKPYQIQQPWVSEYLSVRGFKPVYPGGRQFAVLVSHDVDLLNPPVSAWKTTKKAIKNTMGFNFRQSIEHAKNYITYKNPSNYKLDRLLDFLLKENLNTTLFFFALNKKDIDYQYNLEDHEQTIRSLLKSGFDIGLHGNQKAYFSYEEILRQKELFSSMLGFNPQGYRNHTLSFDVFKTWDYLDKAGFLYDATLGFINDIGFRNGMAYPFNPYCEKSKRFLNILEIPLNIMDVSFTKYLNYNLEDSYKAAVSLIEVVKKQNGVISLLLHHNHLRGKVKTLFYLLIKHLKDNGGWITTHRELTNYWLEKSYNKKINKYMLDIKNQAC